MKYAVPHQFPQNRIKIAVVGVGGTGGEVMDALTRLDFGLKALGHPLDTHMSSLLMPISLNLIILEDSVSQNLM